MSSPTPGWLLAPLPADASVLSPLPTPGAGPRRRRGFLERTLADSADLARATLGGDEIARRPGLLQRLDPRTKLLSLLALLVAAGLVRHTPVLVVAYAATVVLAAASAVPLFGLLRQVWLAVPLFTGLALLPATLSFVVPGEVVLPLFSWDGTPQGFTAQGLANAALVLLRVATSVSLAILLAVTTPWNRLLAGLAALGVPHILVLVVTMAYRYLFLLLATVTDLFIARAARTLGSARHDRSARAFVGSGVAVVFSRAHHLAEEVHEAMVARGYAGRTVPLEPLRFTRADAVAALVVGACVVLLLGGDRLLAR